MKIVSLMYIKCMSKLPERPASFQNLVGSETLKWWRQLSQMRKILDEREAERSENFELKPGLKVKPRKTI